MSKMVAKVFVVFVMVFLLAYSAQNQAATQTDNWCPELGNITYARGVLWLDMYHPYYLSDEGIELLQDMDTSDYVQAHYGDRTRDDDDYWDGAPRDLQPYLQLKVETSEGTRWIGFSESESEPDVMLGMALLSRTVSGSGDQRGMHDICAVFLTDRETVDEIWATGLAVPKSEW